MSLFKTRLHAGQRQIGFWIASGSATMAEVVCGSGIDFLVVDTEHTPLDLKDVLEIARVATGYGLPTVVRPPSLEPTFIRRLLDLGISDLVLPMVESPEQARAVVEATRYPPGGWRGVSLAQRANAYSRTKDYFHEANDGICIIAQIETPPAVKAMEAIAAVDGIDALFVGPSDLAATHGHLGDADHPEMTALKDEIGARAKKTAVSLGTVIGNVDRAKALFAAGYAFVALGSDVGVLRAAADSMVAGLRDVLG